MARIRGMIGEAMTLLGFDGTTYRRVRVDPAGHVQLAPGGVSLQQYHSEYRWSHVTPAGSGTIEFSSPALLPNDLLVLSTVIVVLDAGSALLLTIQVTGGPIAALYDFIGHPPARVPRQLTNPIVLRGGEWLHVTAFGAGTGTFLRAWALGYYVRR